MSAEAVMARVGQIETMMGSLQGNAQTGGATAPSTTFASALQQASSPTATAASAGGSSTPYDAMIADSAQRNGIDPALLKGLIRQESNFNPDAGSSAGARGLTQLMPATAASLGVSDTSDPAQSIDAGAKYLRQQLDRFGGDQAKALAAYNAGPGAVQRFGGVPPYAETQSYVQKVLGYAQQYRSSTSSTTPIGS
jgi:soluble lytic murein transglycosylase-like protein